MMGEWNYNQALDYWEIRGLNFYITLEHRPRYCDRGHYYAKVFQRNPDDVHHRLDDCDGWPRYYFDLDRAKAELVAWMERREQFPKPTPAP